MKGGERMEIMYSVEYRKVGNYDYDYIDYFGRGVKCGQWQKRENLVIWAMTSM